MPSWCACSSRRIRWRARSCRTLPCSVHAPMRASACGSRNRSACWGRRDARGWGSRGDPWQPRSGRRNGSLRRPPPGRTEAGPRSGPRTGQNRRWRPQPLQRDESCWAPWTPQGSFGRPKGNTGACALPSGQGRGWPSSGAAVAGNPPWPGSWEGAWAFRSRIWMKPWPPGQARPSRGSSPRMGNLPSGPWKPRSPARLFSLQGCWPWGEGLGRVQ